MNNIYEWISSISIKYYLFKYWLYNYHELSIQFLRLTNAINYKLFRWCACKFKMQLHLWHIWQLHLSQWNMLLCSHCSRDILLDLRNSILCKIWLLSVQLQTWNSAGSWNTYIYSNACLQWACLCQDGREKACPGHLCFLVDIGAAFSH